MPIARKLQQNFPMPAKVVSNESKAAKKTNKTKKTTKAAKPPKKATPKNEPKINQALLEQISLVVEEKVRPFLQMDGGDMEIIALHEDGLLDVQLTGACVGCPSSTITLSFGVQRILDEEFPEANLQINPL